MTKTDDLTVKDIPLPAAVVAWVGGAKTGYLRLLDQTRLPVEVKYLDCFTPEMVHDAICRLVVRGAPAIGVAGGYGMVVASQSFDPQEDLAPQLEKAAAYLESSRPTAVNLSWAARKVQKRGLCAMKNNPALSAVQEAMLDEAREIHREDEQMCLNIGKHAAAVIMKAKGVLTHCNAGALATAGIGTATAGMYVAHKLGHKFKVYCDETRPLLQGSRLTAWELQKAGIDANVITDNMAAQVMKEGKVDVVIVGSDRISANGDAANKIGTYGVAILAKHHNIPFYVAAPYSTFDMSLEHGDEIPIEQRKGEEITNGMGRRTAPENIGFYNPAFDVTPAELITGIITEKGIISPVTKENVKKAME